MAKEITKAYLLQQLQDKFGLRELEPEIFRFLESVMPVYDIGPHLLTQRGGYKSVSITGTGGVIFFTVPTNERWILSRYDIIFTGAGAITVAGAFVRRAKDSLDVYLDLTAAQTVSYHVGLSSPVILDPGDGISINVDGYTSTQALRMYIDYTKEEIR